MGRIAFIGAGPGAADLITLRGARLLGQADVVLSDALVDPALRDLAPQARWIDVGKRGFRGGATQAMINALLLRHGRAQALVVRLKGGDPSIFGRLEEELQVAAAAGLQAEVVPGVTAALAAAADTRLPLTRRGHGRSISLSTAMTSERPQAAAVPRPSPEGNEHGPANRPVPVRAPCEWPRRMLCAEPPGKTWGGPALSHDGTAPASRSADTEVFYMAGRQLATLARRLMAAGWPAATPTSVVSRAGCADSLHSAHLLAELGQAAMLHQGRPTVVIVGAGASHPDPLGPCGAARPAAQTEPHQPHTNPLRND
ncbi:MAG: SAM-dependent methyltransferase [Thiomonas sp.]|uniref:uroporphyrinogen-III C-methyltransferase n=1 Tax=mine drainage metagenome TaxID=410659 RepID=E6PVZ6_9ZZZZ